MVFLSTLSLRRATFPNVSDQFIFCISIHALLAESDTWQRGSRITYVEFLSTLSLRRATIDASRAANCQQHFYPRSPCGERQGLIRSLQGRIRISIHALLAESDLFRTYPINSSSAFLSTLSLRRATVTRNETYCATMISIHALLAESDSKHCAQ